MSTSPVPASDSNARVLETPAPGRRERRKLELRARIVEAGQTLFEQKGIEATTVIEVCQRADVAHKTFFNHFPSKRHLLREIAQVSLDALLEDIENVRCLPVSSRERIRRFFVRIADDAAAAGPMHRELLTEIVHIAHETGSEPEQARRLHEAFGAVVRDGVAAGDWTDAYGVETLTEMWMGAFYALMFNWANLDDYPLRERAIATAHFLADAFDADRRQRASADRET